MLGTPTNLVIRMAPHVPPDNPVHVVTVCLNLLSVSLIFLESLTKQQICVDIPTMAELKSAKNNPEEEKANKIKQHITLKTMRSIMDGTYQEWIEELTKNEYPQPKM